MTVYFVVIVLGFASGVHLVGSFHYGYHLNNQTGTTYSKVVFYLWLGLISFENLVFTGNQSIKYFVAIPSLISCSWHITIWLIFLILIIRPLLFTPICTYLWSYWIYWYPFFSFFQQIMPSSNVGNCYLPNGNK